MAEKGGKFYYLTQEKRQEKGDGFIFRSRLEQKINLSPLFLLSQITTCIRGDAVAASQRVITSDLDALVSQKYSCDADVIVMRPHLLHVSLRYFAIVHHQDFQMDKALVVLL